MTTTSISRQFATWAAGLTYDALPPAVVDKAKALLLTSLTAARLGGASPAAERVIQLVLAEESKSDGATILVDGRKATRIGATFANAEMMHTSGLVDSYRMMTHTAPVLVPAALANAELEGKSGKDLLVAIVAGYEFMCRLCDDFIPTTAVRAFRPSPIYGTLGAAMVAGKLMGFDADRLVSAIAVATNCASGLFATGAETSVHEPNAARQGVFAAVVVRDGHLKGAEDSLEGPTGFYRAFTGSNKGELTASFHHNVRKVELSTITEGLGSEYKMLNAMFRVYATGGFNQPVVAAVLELKRDHNIDAEHVERVDICMNYLETNYPGPEFPRLDPWVPRVGQAHHVAAHVIVNGGYPVVGGATFGPTGADLAGDQRVLDFMNSRVRVIPVAGQAMLSPEVTIRMKDGRTFQNAFSYSSLTWNFDQLVGRLQDCVPGYAGGQPAFDRLVKAVRSADALTSMHPLYELVNADGVAD